LYKVTTIHLLLEPHAISIKSTCPSLIPVALSNAGANPLPIRFELRAIALPLESDITPAKNAPETMARGVAVFQVQQAWLPPTFSLLMADRIVSA
jgi:hypothetical protein